MGVTVREYHVGRSSEANSHCPLGKDARSFVQTAQHLHEIAITESDGSRACEEAGSLLATKASTTITFSFRTRGASNRFSLMPGFSNLRGGHYWNGIFVHSEQARAAFSETVDEMKLKPPRPGPGRPLHCEDV